LGSLYFVGAGDLIESCDGSYSQQLYEVELNTRDQLKLARRLLRDCLKFWSPDFERVVVSAVPGNHGVAYRKNGKPATDDADNFDVGVVESVAEILAENSAFDHVKFYLPNKEQAVVLDVHGSTIAFLHGHLARGGGVGLPQNKLKNLWMAHAFGNQPIGDATILCSGHYHSFSAIEFTKGRLHLQAPSMESESTWWVNSRGERSTPGTLTFVTSNNQVQDIQVV
jgi:hypothetical protein